MVEGGPIVSPKQLEELCQVAQVDGYIGGSTIDRVPSESAIEVVTAAFKAIGVLRQRIDGLERRLDRALVSALPRGAIRRRPKTPARCSRRLATTDHPVVVVGEPGTGRREVARALHAFSPRKGARSGQHARAASSRRAAELDLFGCAAGAHPSIVKNRLGWLEIARGSSILLDEVENLPAGVQRALLDAVERRHILARSAASALTARRALSRARAAGPAANAGDRHDPRFAEWLGCFTSCCRRCASAPTICRR